MNAVTSQPAIETESVTTCPACGALGKEVLQGCFDYVSQLPGNWTFFECRRCHSLWPNPRPVERALPLLYPEKYGFTRGPADDAYFPSGISGSAKLAVLADHFGYRGARQHADDHMGVALGRALGWMLRGKAGHAVRFLHQVENGNLLDVGCGNGAFMQWMSQLGWNAEGIEVDPVAAARAIERGLTIRVGNIEDVDLPASHFDAVTLTHVTEHFFHPGRVFEILGQCLKLNGVLVSISPNPVGIVRRFFRSHWYGLDPPRHLFLPSATAYHRMLEPLGFEVKTWTSMRLFYCYFKESLSIAAKRTVGGVRDSALLKCACGGFSAFFSCLPQAGEEVICYARKR